MQFTYVTFKYLMNIAEIFGQIYYKFKYADAVILNLSGSNPANYKENFHVSSVVLDVTLVHTVLNI